MKTLIKLSFCFSLLVSGSNYAQVETDNTIGTPQSFSGNMTIPATLGKSAGNNLFHSFKTFNIYQGADLSNPNPGITESVTFTGSGFQNVISRVTGGASYINGALISQIAGANFYFINPAGVTFGPNAEVNVPAAFHVSTADRINFVGGGFYSATDTSGSTLSVAAPESFGFLGNSSPSGTITIDGTSLITKVNASKLDLVANNITIQNTPNTNNVFMPVTEVRLIATNGVSNISVQPNSLGALPLPNADPSSANAGNILINNSGVKSQANGGTRIALWGNQIDVSNKSNLFNSNNGTAAPTADKGIEIHANVLNVTGNNLSSGNALIGSDAGTGSTGDAGAVFIKSNTVNVVDGATIRSNAGSSSNGGNAGSVTVNSDTVNITNGATISSSTFSAGKAGNVSVTAKLLNIDAQGRTTGVTGISSASNATGAVTTGKGDGGTVTVVADTLNIQDGGIIRTSTFTNGNAGSLLSVKANVLTIDGKNNTAFTGIASRAGSGSSGNAGTILVNAGKLEMSNNGKISSETASTGKAGIVDVTATSDLVLDNNAEISAKATSTSTGQTGEVTVTANNATLSNGGKVTIQNDGTATAPNLVQPGTLKFAVSNLTMNNGFITAATSKNVNAGTVTVKAANAITEANKASINSSTSGIGNAGIVTVSAPVILMDNASIKATAETGSTGSAGNVTVVATQSLTGLNSASINSSTFSSGKAGDVTVDATNLLLDSNAEISAKAGNTSTGQTGKVKVTATNVNLTNGGEISVQNDGTSTNPALVTPGTLNLTASNLAMDRGFITAATSKNVNAGTVTVNASNQIREVNGSSINSSTSGTGNAGSVMVTAPIIHMDNSSVTAKTTAAGNAGSVTVNASNGLSETNNATINSSTFGTGNAGSVVVTAPNISIDNSSITAKTTAAGNAGSVTVNASNGLSETNNATINSSTAGKGTAGSVDVSASVISLDNSDISAAASIGSSGQTGNVTVTASQALNLSNNAKITMQNDATVANAVTVVPTKITVTSPNITLANSEITTAATGNIKASDIVVNFSEKLMMDPSYILTTANTGDGGNIYINGGKLIYLQDSAFLTSVKGENSNGGNIYVNADFLVMNTAAIQANAIGGFGGDIFLNLKGLIPSYDKLILAGEWVDWQPFIPGFNVIQAASQKGISGNINNTSPQFNISGSLSGLDSSALVLPVINRSLCDSAVNSSLAARGKGGIPITDVSSVFFPTAVMPSGQTASAGQKEELNYSVNSGDAPLNTGCDSI
jgi:filamentous hemagglutinin family protein